MKKVLITGNLGYIGPVLSKFLKKSLENVEIIGFDSGYFAHCLTDLDKHPEIYTDHQIYGDIRNFDSDLLNDVDCVIHLSAISNDPIGNQYKKLTYEINRDASVKLFKLAVKQKVTHFIFASSCSVYGKTSKKYSYESSLTNPLTSKEESPK